MGDAYSYYDRTNNLTRIAHHRSAVEQTDRCCVCVFIGREVPRKSVLGLGLVPKGTSILYTADTQKGCYKYRVGTIRSSRILSVQHTTWYVSKAGISHSYTLHIPVPDLNRQRLLLKCNTRVLHIVEIPKGCCMILLYKHHWQQSH